MIEAEFIKSQSINMDVFRHVIYILLYMQWIGYKLFMIQSFENN